MAQGFPFRVKDMMVATGGVLIAVLNFKDAARLDVHALDRILVRCGRRKTVAAVDIAESDRAVPPGSVGLFQEVMDKVRARQGSRVFLDYAKKPESLEYIKRKLDGRALSKKETYAIIRDVVRDELTVDELSYYVSACYTRGMTIGESIDLTTAIVDLGSRVRTRNGFILDKHCIGGIPNNRTTMIVVPIIVAAGFKIPKTSSRSITSPSGTADTMEVLAPVGLPLGKMESMVKRIGGFIAWGGAVSLAAADDKLIKVRHTLSLDPEGMLLASILAKKSAAGATHVLIDIPIGKDTKIHTVSQARRLERQFHRIGSRLGMSIKVMISDGEEPVGNGIGPALEARDVLYILRRDPKRPLDLERKSVRMAGLLLEMAGVKDPTAKARSLLESGAALVAMKDIIKAQGGDPDVEPEQIPVGAFTRAIRAPRAGKVVDINTELVSHVARVAGAPIDKGAGMYMHVHESAMVSRGDPLLTIYAESMKKLRFALEEYKRGKVVAVR